MAKWLMMPSHRKKILGLGPFYVEFACSPLFELSFNDQVFDRSLF